MDTSKAREINETLKEATAITVMRYMLTQYARDHQVSFEEALLQFSRSKTYNGLFDYETAIWKEGPDYLRGLYDEERALLVR